MQTILEHGIVVVYNSNSEFEFMKQKIDSLAAEIKDNFPHESGMHTVSLSNNAQFTCNITNGQVRFGICTYDTNGHSLRRYCTYEEVLLLTKSTIDTLIRRLSSSVKKQVDLPPLNQLWNLSLQKESLLSDKNGLVELEGPESLTTTFISTEEPIQNFPQITL